MMVGAARTAFAAARSRAAPSVSARPVVVPGGRRRPCASPCRRRGPVAPGRLRPRDHRPDGGHQMAAIQAPALAPQRRAPAAGYAVRSMTVDERSMTRHAQPFDLKLLFPWRSMRSMLCVSCPSIHCSSPR